MAPPTDDIDSEWGADDDIPAAPPAAKLSVPAPSAPSAPTSSAAAPSAPPAQAASSTPVPSVRPSSPPRPVSSAPPVARIPTPVPSNPLRKQTLLGIAPVIPERAEPPATIDAAAPKEPLTLEASNPLRKQTLLGIAPVLPSAPKAPERTLTAAETPSAKADEPNVKADGPSAKGDEPSVKIDVAATVPSLPKPLRPVTTDAPVMSDTTADSAVSSIDADLAPLRPKRSRWLLPLVAAAAIGLGVFGLRQLDTPPVAAVPAPPATPLAAKPAPQPEKAIEASPAATPEPAEPAAAPVADAPVAPVAQATAAPVAQAAAAPVADAAAAAKPAEAQPSPAPSAEPAAPASGDLRQIAVTSDPPGARLFWRGKEVGTTPFTLELRADEKHAYELGLPGYVTRKVVIDGSKSEINIGMRPQAGPFTGANSRK